MCLTVSRQSRDHRPLSRDPSVSFYKKFPNCLKRRKTLFDSRPTVAWTPTTVAWPFSDFFQNFPKSLETSKKRCLTVGRRSRDLNHCRMTVQRLFSKFSQTAWNVQKTLFDSRPTVAWTPTTVAWPFSDFFQNFPKSLETSKKRCLTVGRRSRDLNHCRVTVQRHFSKFSQIAWNVQKTLFDSRPTVAWTPTTVAWPFSDFFQNFPKSLETSKKRCLTVGRRSRDLRPLSRDRSATFFKMFPNCLKRPRTLFDSQPTVAWPPTTVAWPFSDFFQNFPKSLETSKNVVSQTADGRVTTDHCRVTLRWVFTKSFLIAWNVEKRCLTVGRRSRELRPLSRDRSATFFKIFPNRLKRPKNVVWQSADGRVTSTTVAWPFSDFFQNFLKPLETSKKRCLTVGRQSRELRPLSRDRSATFFKIFPNRLKRPKNVVWQSADGRVTWTTVAWPFSDIFQNFPKSLETSKKRCLTVGRQSRELRPLSRDRSATFFKIFPNRLKRPKNVVWQSADGRVTSDHSRVTVQRLFSKCSQIAWNVQERCLTVSRRSRDLRPLSRDRSATFFKIFPNRLKRPKTLFHRRPTVAWPPTTVAWPFSDFFQNFPKSLETSKKRCLTVGRRSRDLRPLSRDRSATFFKKISNCLKRRKIVVWQSADGRVTSDHSRTASHTASQMYISFLFLLFARTTVRATSDHCRVTVQRLFPKKFLIARNVEKSLFDSRPTVAWPPTTVTWPFSDFFQKNF